jgi:hypothetical protein
MLSRCSLGNFALDRRALERPARRAGRKHGDLVGGRLRFVTLLWFGLWFGRRRFPRRVQVPGRRDRPLQRVQELGVARLPRLGQGDHVAVFVWNRPALRIGLRGLLSLLGIEKSTHVPLLAPFWTRPNC